MKKLVLAIMVAALVCSMFAYTQQAIPKQELAQDNLIIKGRAEHRDAPACTFVVEPIDIQTSYYDYMPGSYISNPLRVQTNNVAGQNGLYCVFHSTETASAERRVYIGYINADGTLNSVNYLNQEDIKEGYPGMDIDHETQDPMAIWHIDMDDDTIYEDALGYDSWHLLQSPGLISTPFDVIDNNDWSGYDFEPPYSDDEFIWPYVWIVQGPNYDTDQSRRVYVWASNYTSHHADPSENMLLGYADFTTSNLDAGTLNTLDWNFVTFPLLDYYNSGEGDWGRYNKGIACNDNGQIAMIGYLSADDIEHEGSDMVVFYNDTWAEGDWEVVEVDAHTVVDMPTNQDGTPYFDAIEAGEEIFFDWVNSSHPEAMFDSQGKLHFVGNYVLGYENVDGEHNLWAYFSTVKHCEFDPETSEITFHDLYPQSTIENPTFPYLPWDENQDGEMDEYYEDGTLMSNLSWPIWWYGWDEAFHENTYKIAKNEDKNWLVAVWHDGLYSRFYNESGDEEYVDWATVPEIAISLSADNGANWSDPIFLNSIDNPELAGMIPTYVYPGDIVEDLGEEHGLLHLMFYDDNSFGSFIQGQGSNDGGMLRYCSVDIDFTDLPIITANDNEDVAPVAGFGLTNFPNPFNPTTTVEFSIPEKADVKLSVYNVKGQLVKTLVDSKLDAGTQAFTWHGVDNTNKPVSSGVYFYKLEVGSKSEIQKMLMLK